MTDPDFVAARRAVVRTLNQQSQCRGDKRDAPPAPEAKRETWRDRPPLL